jgi:large subunit ribosomal protein L15
MAEGRTTTRQKAAGATAVASEAAGEPGGRAGLKIHHLRPAPGAHIHRSRVGRGEASKGKTAGRGTKGSKARTQVPEAFEGGQMPLTRRLPKLKGFSNSQFKTTYQVINLDRLAALYPDGGEVNPHDLAAKGAVRPGELVKVLGQGEVTAALQVSAHRFSATARAKIAAAGGTVTEL